MQGYCGVLGNYIIDTKAFESSINLAGTMCVETVAENNFFSAVSYLEKSPLNGPRIYAKRDLIFLFAGDLIGYEDIPWKDIEKNVIKSNYNWFSTLRGLFSFVIYNKKLKKITVISDHRAQLPMYYGVFDDSFIFSTDLSTFTTLNIVPEFNKEWLYEYLFFNYPILGTTFLTGVSRNRPLSVLNFDLESRVLGQERYSELLDVANNIKTGEESLNTNIESFEKRIPQYLISDKTNVLALSGGFDSRTILSLAPKGVDIKTYTYGVENSYDLDTVYTFIDRLNIENNKIFFDEEFKKSLSTLIYETVRLSGGVQPILRSTLLYVYKKLYEKYEDAPVVLGGISGDFFRGLGLDLTADTSVVSYEMKLFFNSGEISIDDKKFPLKKEFQSELKEHIRKNLEELKNLYGDPKSAKAIMSYAVYEKNPNYFGGEMAVAGNYFTFRQPFWDIDLINMAFSTDVGHIGYLKRLRENRDTTYYPYVLQSKIITRNPKFKKTKIKGMPIGLFAINNKTIFKISRLFIRGFAYFKDFNKPVNGLEEWNDWFEKTLQSDFDKLLNENSLILKYFDIKILERVKKTNDIHLLSKMATTEIILNLIKNRWNIK